MSAAPDYAEPLIGWRTWAGVEEDGDLTLRSIVYDSRWTPGRRLEAACAHRARSRLLARLLRTEAHEAPGEGCECGIYAARAPDLILPYLDRHALLRWARSAVVGRVALWGRVIECERGWRGTFAYPTRLYVLRAALTSRDEDADALADRLGVYGVPRGGRRRAHQGRAPGRAGPGRGGLPRSLSRARSRPAVRQGLAKT